MPQAAASISHDASHRSAVSSEMAELSSRLRMAARPAWQMRWDRRDGSYRQRRPNGDSSAVIPGYGPGLAISPYVTQGGQPVRADRGSFMFG